jgi:fibronectin type 3 domain-containing protein/regulation of enolase protein 1 (concanavalin A-like superfamily)
VLEARLVLDLAGLPILHSLPGAPAAIYLDFNGGTYGSTTYLPYDVDGNYTSFNAAEQATIIEAHRHISVYFSMFNVDVTTQNPTVPKVWHLTSNSVSGGYSSVNVFPNTQPRSFNQSSDARTRQSGIAHEVGHNFGNNHQSDWDLLAVRINEYSSGYDSLHGPIMGVDYAQNVHKWFIGHPTNSAGNLQDDLAVIAADLDNYGGDGYRADDYGNTIATAAPLSALGGRRYASGIIERMTDVDAFSFASSGGPVRFEAVPIRPSGVDLKMEVYSSAGVLLAAADSSVNEQRFTLTLPAGTYYVLLSSHGDYGDLGSYNLNVSLLPAGWDTLDIGPTGFGSYIGYGGYGAYNAANGVYNVGGSGSDIWGTADQFRFVYLPLTGDGSVTARVTANEATHASSKAGVMIRNGLGTNTANAFMTLTNGTVAFQTRTAAGGSTTAVNGPGGITAPYWVRVVRTGDTLTGFRSPDGINWTQQGTATITMGSTVQIGLAVTSHNNDAINDATFDNVTVTGNVGTPPPTYNGLPAPAGLTLSLGTGTGINLSWSVVTGATGYAIDRSSDGATWSQIATTSGAGATSYSNTGLFGSQRYFYRVSALQGSTRSVPSAVATTVNRPNAPFNITVTPWTSNRAIVNWRDVSGDTGYRIERSTNGTTWTQIATVGRNVPSYINTSLTSGVTYYYRIFATSPQGDSLPSVVAATNNSLGVNFTTVAANQIVLAWSPVVGARYRIERSLNGVSYTPLTVTSTGTLTYTDNTVVGGTTYYYRVMAETSATTPVARSPWAFVSATTPGANNPPVLAAIPSQTIPASQQVLSVALSATDVDGDPLTFTATGQSLAYVLTQQTGPLTYFSIYDNLYGAGEKWLQAADSQWYFILASGEFYRWNGSSSATGTLLGNVGASYHADANRLVNVPINQPRATLSIAGSVLTITRDLAWTSAMVITVTVSDGRGGTDSKTFNVIVTASTNQPPVLQAIPNQTVPSSQQVISVPLVASDPDGDPLTFSWTAQSLAYVLTQQTGPLTYFSIYDNVFGAGEKWLQAADSQWYFILANGEFYRWNGSGSATGTLLGNVGSSYYADANRLVNVPANQPRAMLSISGTTLTITRDLSWISAIVVTVTVSDGSLTDSKTFTVTVV